MSSVLVQQTVPRTTHLEFPGTGVMRAMRRVGWPTLQAYFDVKLHDTGFVPRVGPVILAANHIGTVDGPLLALAPGRTVFTMAKDELFTGALGWGLRQAGQIPLARHYADVAAIRRAIHVLRCGKTLGIFPEGARGAGTCEDLRPGVAYLALVTGAPIVPVAFLGTRVPGTHRSSVPPRGTTMHMVFGRPFSLDAIPFPRRRDDVAEAMAVIGPRLRAHVAAAETLTGMGLPGHVREDCVPVTN